MGDIGNDPGLVSGHRGKKSFHLKKKRAPEHVGTLHQFQCGHLLLKQ